MFELRSPSGSFYWEFLPNPEELSIPEPVRFQLLQTAGGVYIDNFGRGIAQISLQGTTGWSLRSTSTGEADGVQQFKKLRNQVYRAYIDGDNTSAPDEYELRLHDVGLGDTYIVFPTQFQLSRSRTRPLLFQYNFQLVVIDVMPLSISKSFGGTESSASNASTIQDPVERALSSLNYSKLSASLWQDCSVLRWLDWQTPNAPYTPTLTTTEAAYLSQVLANTPYTIVSQETLNQTNYPGIGSFLDQVDQAVSNIESLASVIQSASPSQQLPIKWMTAVNYRSTVQGLKSNIDNMMSGETKNMYYLNTLTDLQIQLGKLIGQPQVFAN